MKKDIKNIILNELRAARPNDGLSSLFLNYTRWAGAHREYLQHFLWDVFQAFGLQDCQVKKVAAARVFHIHARPLTRAERA